MKIALVIFHADGKRGGAERYTLDLAVGLSARGHDVSLLASSFGDEGVSARQVPIEARGWTRVGRYRRFLRSLDEHLAGERYGVVHAMLPVRQCDVYHPHAGIEAEAIATSHEKYSGAIRQKIAQAAIKLNRKRQRFARVERELLTPSNGPIVLCLSNYIKNTVRRHYAIQENRLVRLFNGVDLDKFDPGVRPDAGAEIRRRLVLGPQRVVAVMIAQDFVRKGLAEAIIALPREDKRLVLIVVGKNDAKPYERLVRDEKLTGRVIFVGSTDDPYAYYRAADLFVLPTRHDPCSLVVLEALAMGVPVVSTENNGACEIMRDGVHGFVLPIDRTDAILNDCYIQLLDEDRRREMSRACHALRPQLSQQHHLDQLLGVYELATSRRNGTFHSADAHNLRR